MPTIKNINVGSPNRLRASSPLLRINHCLRFSGSASENLTGGGVLVLPNPKPLFLIRAGPTARWERLGKYFGHQHHAKTLSCGLWVAFCKDPQLLSTLLDRSTLHPRTGERQPPLCLNLRWTRIASGGHAASDGVKVAES